MVVVEKEGQLPGGCIGGGTMLRVPYTRVKHTRSNLQQKISVNSKFYVDEHFIRVARYLKTRDI